MLPVLALFHFPVVFLYSFLFSRAEVLIMMLDSFDDGNVLLRSLLMFLGGVLFYSLFNAFLKRFVSGAMIFAAWRRTAFGEKATMRDMMRAGGRLLLCMLALELLADVAYMALYYLAVFILAASFGVFGAVWAAAAAFGRTLLLIAGILVLLALAALVIYIALRLSLMAPAIVIDRAGPFSAFRFSWKATKKQTHHMLGIFLSALLTSLAVNSAVSALTTVFTFRGKVFAAALSAIIASVGALSTYIWSLSSAFFYMRRKVELKDENGFELRLAGFLKQRGV